MGNFGLLPEGFVPATIADVRAEQEEGLRATFGRSLPLGNRTLLGFMIGAISERLGQLWELAELAFTSLDADKATGAMLEALSLLTATFRAAAAKSTVYETLCGDDGTVIAAEFVIATDSTGKNFRTFVDCTLVLLADWAPTTTYARGDRVTNSSRCYGCLTGGVSAGGGGPVTTAVDITDGTAHWIYLGEGTACVDVLCVSEETGEVVAVAGDLTAIASPTGGLNTARNILDADLGSDLMADQDLRLLREAELSQPGTGPPDAIRAALLLVDGVTHATVFFNNTELTVDGLPPHSCSALVQGGNDQHVIDCLWANVPIGIGTIGTTAGIALDAEGNEQPINFSRPVLVVSYQYIVVVKNPKTYVGDEALKTAISTWGKNRSAGDDVEPSAIASIAFVPGVIRVLEVRVYTDVIAAGAAWIASHAYVATPGARSVVTNDDRSYICVTGGVTGDGTAGHTGPSSAGVDVVDGAAHWRFLGAPIVVDNHSLATYDTTRMTVVSTDGTP